MPLPDPSALIDRRSSNRYKCSLGKTFRSANGIDYAVPDAVKVTGSSRSNDVTKVIRSKTAYSKSESSSTGVSTGYGFFSASVEMNQAQQEIGNKENIIVETSSTIALFTATLDPPEQLVLEGSYEKMVDALPADYNRSANPTTEPYWMLIRYYGTHYVRYAQFGGSVKMKNVVTQSYVETKSDSSIAVEASASYAGATVGASHSNSESSSDSEFSKNSQKTTTQIGGNPAIKALSDNANGPSNAFADWVDSISSFAPAQVAYRLDDLWRLITDPVKAKNLRLAIDDYASNAPCRAGGCLSGGKFLGGVELVDDRCRQFCSPYGFCGTTEDYRSGEGAIDCSEFDPERIYNPPPERPPPGNPVCRENGCKAGDPTDGGVKLVNGMCMQICSAGGKCGAGSAYAGEGSSDCRSLAKQPKPPNPRQRCEVHLKYSGGKEEVMSFEGSKDKVKEGDRDYEDNIESFKLMSNPGGSGGSTCGSNLRSTGRRASLNLLIGLLSGAACAKLVVYDEDEGCGNDEDAVTYEGDFTWKEVSQIPSARRSPEHHHPDDLTAPAGTCQSTPLRAGIHSFLARVPSDSCCARFPPAAPNRCVSRQRVLQH